MATNSDVDNSTGNTLQPQPLVRNRLIEISQQLKGRTNIVKQGLSLSRQSTVETEEVVTRLATSHAEYDHFFGVSFDDEMDGSDSKEDKPMSFERLKISSEFVNSFINEFDGEEVRYRANEAEINWMGISRNGAVDPCGWAHRFWLVIISIVFVYNFISITLRCSFPQYQMDLVGWLVVDYATDFLILLDIMIIKPRLINYRGNQSVNDREQLRRTYFKSWMFAFDICSILPLDFFYLAVGGVQPYFRCFRLLSFRSYRLMFIQFQLAAFTYKEVINIINIMINLLLFTHLYACIFSATSKNALIITQSGDVLETSLTYARCFYYAFNVAVTKNVTTLAHRFQTNGERVLMIIFRFAGLAMVASIMSHLYAYFYMSSKESSRVRRLISTARGYAKRFRCSAEIESKIVSWLLHSQQQEGKPSQERNFRKWIPKHLMKDIFMDLHYPVISKLSIFQGCEHHIVGEVLARSKIESFFPKDVIFGKGDVAKSMFYVILEGKVDIMNDNGQVMKSLNDGAMFGEVNNLSPGLRQTFTALSRGYSDIFVLMKEDFEEIIACYPNIYRRLQKEGIKEGNRNALNKDEREEIPLGPIQPIVSAGVSSRPSTPKILKVILSFWNGQSSVWKRLTKVGPVDEEQHDSIDFSEEEPELTELTWSSPSLDEIYIQEDWELHHYETHANQSKLKSRNKDKQNVST